MNIEKINETLKTMGFDGIEFVDNNFVAGFKGKTEDTVFDARISRNSVVSVDFDYNKKKFVLRTNGTTDVEDILKFKKDVDEAVEIVNVLNSIK